jgi:DEAD/DEAH box helicase domain-containing protein
MGLKTIIFTRARKITELITTWVLNDAPELRHRISSYRAGFLPEERREIESRLFSGEMDGVISTSALEMGIDVGGLDLCLLVGYPGTIINTWQRGGRVGRSGRSSCIVLIAGHDALDQYFLNNPQDFFTRNCEEAILDPFNAEVLRKHLPCAAAETPLDPDEDWIKIPEVSSVVGDLEREGKLYRTKVNGHLHCGTTRPQRDVDLRGIGTSYPIFLDDRKTMIGSSGGIRAFTECHEGAVYLHRARQYVVTKLDLERRNIFVKPTKVDYYTKALSEKDTEILGHPVRSNEFGGFTVREARLKVTENIVGYEKRRTQGQELIGTVELNLPPVHFETVGIWIEIPDKVKTLIEDSDLHFMGGIHALEHAAISMFPLFALCDRNDIGGISTPQHPQVCKAAVFIYDGHPGGVGLAHRAFDLIWELLGKTLKLVQGCRCEEGCPSCIHSPKCGSGNKPLDKDACIAVLDYLLHPEKLKSPVVGRGVPKGQRKTIVKAKPAKIGLQKIDDDPEIIPPWRSKPKVKIDRTKSPKGPLLFPDMVVDAVSGSVVMPIGLEFQASTKTPRPSQKQIEQAREVLFINQSPGSAPQNVVVFDIETKKTAAEVGGWHKVRDMEIAVLVAHSESEGFRSFTEKNVDDFILMLKKADLVVGFNHMRFDYEVLSAYTDENLRSLPNLDILQYVEKTIGFKLKLDHLAEFTLGRNKTANGLEAVEWFRQGRIDLVEEYCKEDVKITRDLYLHGLKNGYLQFRKKNLQICKLNVNWDFAALGFGFQSHHFNRSRGR